jgi:hypothetical protein
VKVAYVIVSIIVDPNQTSNTVICGGSPGFPETAKVKRYDLPGSVVMS